MGPVAIAFLVGAFAAAFLKARSEQLARHHLTTDPPEGETRLLPRSSGERYTAEGREHIRRARRFRALLYLLGLGSMAATWLGF